MTDRAATSWRAGFGHREEHQERHAGALARRRFDYKTPLPYAAGERLGKIEPRSRVLHLALRITQELFTHEVRAIK